MIRVLRDTTIYSHALDMYDILKVITFGEINSKIHRKTIQIYVHVMSITCTNIYAYVYVGLCSKYLNDNKQVEKEPSV